MAMLKLYIPSSDFDPVASSSIVLQAQHKVYHPGGKLYTDSMESIQVAKWLSLKKNGLICSAVNRPPRHRALALVLVLSLRAIG